MSILRHSKPTTDRAPESIERYDIDSEVSRLFQVRKRSVADIDDDDDCRFVKRITQDASTALRVPVRCEEVSFQR